MKRVVVLSLFLFLFNFCGTTEEIIHEDTKGTDKITENNDVTEIKEASDVVETNDTSTFEAEVTENEVDGKDILNDGGKVETVSHCGEGVPVCLDENGLSDLSLCPDPKSDYDCIDGCCIKKFKCKSNDECEEKKGEIEECPYDNFHCHCNVDTGKCFTWFCSDNSSCQNAGYEGYICLNGICVKEDEATNLMADIKSGNIVIFEAEEITPKIVAVSKDDSEFVTANKEFEIVITDGDGKIEKVSDQTIKGGNTYGLAKIKAKIKGAGDETLSPAVTVLNLTPASSGKLKVYVYDEKTLEPVNSAKIVVEANGNTIFYGQSENGFVEIDYPADTPFNIHVFDDNYQYASFVGITENTVAIPLFKYFYAKITVEKDKSVIPEKQEIVNGDLITGSPDYSLYQKFGEFEVGITNFAFSQGIFDFNLKLIIGPDVEEYFDPDAPTYFPKEDPQIIPGGVTFGFDGPVIPNYFLADRDGEKILWSISGRISINDLTTQMGNIIDALSGGDFDFASLISTLFPLFKTFSSGIVQKVNLSDSPQFPPKKVDVLLKYPMSFFLNLNLPELPTVVKDDQWADIVIVMVGAMLPDAEFVPLGINAMSDKVNKDDVPDGIIDGVPETPDKIDPLAIYFAPMHTGISTEFADYYLILTALTVNTGGSSKKPEAASGKIIKLNDHSKFNGSLYDFDHDYLKIPDSSTLNKDTGEFVLENISDIDFYRIILKGKKEKSWFIYLAPGTLNFKIPDIATFNEELSGFKFEIKDYIVNGLKLKSGISFENLIAAGYGYTNQLIKFVEDTTYINLR